MNQITAQDVGNWFTLYTNKLTFGVIFKGEKFIENLIYKSSRARLLQGDCLELMKKIPDQSVDMILCDLPYGTTKCSWDTIIDFKLLWEQYNRIIKPQKAIALFGSEPFSSSLRLSNIEDYKYDWIWDKKIPSGMCNSKIQPMRQTENISIFVHGKSFYYPQMTKRDVPIKSGGMIESLSGGSSGLKRMETKTYDEKYPTTLITFDKIRRGSVHPTQKPVDLLEYLIKTYTVENEIVLDNCMGSGSTGVAALNINRRFIGIELDTTYCDIAKKRIQDIDSKCA
jgi:site-specific DNA-methyltransferase (adenine-specific)